MHATVESLAGRALVIRPRLYLLPDGYPRALSAGRGAGGGAALAVSTGLLGVATPAELEGIVAHELAHLRRRDVLVQTVVVIIAECLPYTHSSNGVPALLLGKLGGKIQTGRVIDAKGASNKTLMSTVLKAFEVDPVQFGSTTLTGVLA